MDESETGGSPEGRAPGAYGQVCPKHGDARLLWVTGRLQRVLFPWQQPQPVQGKAKKVEEVGWSLEKDGHWEAEVRCACGAASWCLGDLARADACQVLRDHGEEVPKGADPEEEKAARGMATEARRAELKARRDALSGGRR